jgi:hypothetical protein
VGTPQALELCLAQLQGAERLSTLPLCLQHAGRQRQLARQERQVFA